MSQATYDVLIVGSGPAGVSAAFPLLAAGLKVAMVDGSHATALPARADRVIESFGADLSALLPQDDRSPKQRLYRSRQLTREHAERTGLESRDFRASGAIARGGLSTVWGAYVAEFDDADLHGYPITAADLRASYDAVARRIGISGISDDPLGPFHGTTAGLLPPPPLHPAAAILLDAAARATPGPLTLGRARNALLTVAGEAHGGRAACVLCKGCLWRCAGNSIYASVHDLPRLRGLPGFALVDDFYVERIGRAGELWEASGPAGNLRARRILLAAGTLGSTRILLESFGMSEQPVRMLSNPLVALPVWVPKAAWQAEAASGHSLAQLGLRMELAGSGYAAGALYSLEGLPLDFITAKLPLSLAGGSAVSAWLAGSLLVATVYFPGSHSANTLSLQPGPGGARLRVQGGARDDFAAVCAALLAGLRRQLRRFGALPLPGAQQAPMGLDNHYAGTCPMGGSGPLATDAHGALLAASGVHVVDGAALPNLPAKHLTFTIMANADRIARAVAAQMAAAGPAA